MINDNFNHAIKKEKLDKCFISYSNKNKNIGHQVKNVLEMFSISTFLAHEDIECSQEWQERILNELNEIDLFIPILSKEFDESCFCNQEVGIAIFRGVLIVPLSIDGTIPKGFLAKIQSKLLEPNANNLVDILIKASPNCMINNIIDELNFRHSYDDCYDIFVYLDDYFDLFDENNVINLVEVSIRNNQIHNSFKCRNSLRKFFRINEDKIPNDLVNDFKEKCML